MRLRTAVMHVRRPVMHMSLMGVSLRESRRCTQNQGNCQYGNVFHGGAPSCFI